MEHLFLPYDLSMMAKIKGFNEPCLAYYNSITKEIGYTYPSHTRYHINTVDKLFPSAPLYQQIIDWLRKTHKIHIQIFIGHDEDKIWYNFDLEPVELGYNYEPHTCDTDVEGYDKENGYYLTLNKAITEAFKIIK